LWVFLEVVVLVTQKTDTSLAISNQLLTVLGTVLGLVISFRTSSAYERCDPANPSLELDIIDVENLDTRMVGKCGRTS